VIKRLPKVTRIYDLLLLIARREEINYREESVRVFRFFAAPSPVKSTRSFVFTLLSRGRKTTSCGHGMAWHGAGSRNLFGWQGVFLLHTR
jgi:hypothetical protein